VIQLPACHAAANDSNEAPAATRRTASSMISLPTYSVGDGQEGADHAQSERGQRHPGLVAQICSEERWQVAQRIEAVAQAGCPDGERPCPVGIESGRAAIARLCPRVAANG
jgi:hypothetical protein